jgi:hypothetical protein
LALLPVAIMRSIFAVGPRACSAAGPRACSVAARAASFFGGAARAANGIAGSWKGQPHELQRVAPAAAKGGRELQWAAAQAAKVSGTSCKGQHRELQRPPHELQGQRRELQRAAPGAAMSSRTSCKGQRRELQRAAGRAANAVRDCFKARSCLLQVHMLLGWSSPATTAAVRASWHGDGFHLRCRRLLQGAPPRAASRGQDRFSGKSRTDSPATSGTDSPATTIAHRRQWVAPCAGERRSRLFFPLLLRFFFG